MLAATDILLGLQIAIAILVLVLLYHLLFVVVDLRKILRRMEEMTSQVEDMLLKPIAMADTLFQWIIDIVEEHAKKAERKKAKAEKKVSKPKKK